MVRRPRLAVELPFTWENQFSVFMFRLDSTVQALNADVESSLPSLRPVFKVESKELRAAH